MSEAFRRISLGAAGLITFLAGFALLGGTFEFIDAYRHERPMLMVPAIVMFCIAVAVLICFGGAAVVAAMTTPPTNGEVSEPDSKEGE